MLVQENDGDISVLFVIFFSCVCVRVNMHMCMYIHMEARAQSRTLPSRTASFVTGSFICFYLFDGWGRVFVLQGAY